MRYSMDRQSNAILHSDLAQQLRNVRLHCALFYSEFARNFTIGTAGNQQPQNFALAIADFVISLRLHFSRRGRGAFDEGSQDSSRSPDGAGVHLADSAFEFLGRRVLANISL